MSLKSFNLSFSISESPVFGLHQINEITQKNKNKAMSSRKKNNFKS